MQVRQIQVANDQLQDRLVLRIATGSNEEIRVFFTRRFLRELWPALTAMLAGHLQSRPSLSPEKPAAPTAAAAGGAANFEQPFHDDNPVYPLGSKPLLASEMTLEPAGEGVARLHLREGRERSFNLNLNNELLQALCSMLRAAADKARWDLVLDYGAPTVGTPLTPAAPKTLLH